MNTQLDTTSLRAPVDRAEVRAFTARLRQEGKLQGRTIEVIVYVVVGLAAALVIGPVAVQIVSTSLTRGSGNLLTFLPVLVLLAIIGVVATAIVRGFSGASTRRYRLDRFARENGMTWHPGYAQPSLPGMIFDLGRSRESHDLMRRTDPRLVEVANYTYETGSGKHKTTHRWGYLAMRLSTPLPHIVLDAVGNNGLFGGSNLPVNFGRAQRLSLEGDFDKYFALYCPEGYERDALYLFTPDVMERFVDNAAALDVEIVDDWLFLYAKRDLSTLDPATWQWLFSVVDALDDKLAQWARWRDGRLARPRPSASSATPLLTPPPAGVARQGRRLRRGVPWFWVGAFGLLGGWWLLTFLFGR